MKEKKYNESIQNIFTAYLVTALDNRKKSYYEQKGRTANSEYLFPNSIEKGTVEFEKQFLEYLKDCEVKFTKDWNYMNRILSLIENEKLLVEIKKLSKKEQTILLARIFGELSFKEIGEKLNISAKQAEMSYYYVLRKLRKGVGKNGF